MKTTHSIKGLFVLFLLPLFCSSAQAQDLQKNAIAAVAARPQNAPEDKDIKEEAIALVASWQEAYNAADVNTLMTLYTYDVLRLDEKTDNSTTLRQSDLEVSFRAAFNQTHAFYVDSKVTNTEVMPDGKIKMSITFNNFAYDRKTGELLNGATDFYENTIVRVGRNWKICSMKHLSR